MGKKGYIWDGTQWVQVSAPSPRSNTVFYQTTASAALTTSYTNLQVVPIP